MGPNAWLMSDLALALPAFQLAEVEGERVRERELQLRLATLLTTERRTEHSYRTHPQPELSPRTAQ